MTHPLPMDLREQAAIRVVLCDDGTELRRLVRATLEADAHVEVVDEAGTGCECVRIASERRPDVALLDLSMPDMDGLEALPLIAESSPATRIIVFSACAAEQLRRPALEQGADRYIEKGTPLDLLAAAVQEVARGLGDVPRRAGGSGSGRLAKWDRGSEGGAGPRPARQGEVSVEGRHPIG